MSEEYETFCGFIFGNSKIAYNVQRLNVLQNARGKCWVFRPLKLKTYDTIKNIFEI